MKNSLWRPPLQLLLKVLSSFSSGARGTRRPKGSRGAQQQQNRGGDCDSPPPFPHLHGVSRRSKERGKNLSGKRFMANDSKNKPDSTAFLTSREPSSSRGWARYGENLSHVHCVVGREDGEWTACERKEEKKAFVFSPNDREEEEKKNNRASRFKARPPSSLSLTPLQFLFSLHIYTHRRSRW